jgi:hypothetical protein
VEQARIIAVGLLTRRDLDLLGPSFSRAWPVEQAPDFAEMLRAIDKADAELRREENKNNGRAREAPGRSWFVLA